MAGVNLEVIWSAQRLYFSNNSAFAASLDELKTANLLDGQFLANINASNSPFSYSIAAADNTGFTAAAQRQNSAAIGSLLINETGSVSGSVTGNWGTVAPGARN